MVLAGEKGQQALRQGQDILLALAQGRHDNIHHVQAIEQIFPEPAGLDRRGQIDAGGRNDAHVGLAGFHLADPFVLLFLEDPQQLGLQRQGQVPDFIEEQGAALAGGDPAQMISQRPGEGPLDMAEKFALQKLQPTAKGRRRPQSSWRRGGSRNGWPGPEWSCRCRSRPRIRRVASLSATRWARARVFCMAALRLVRSASGAASLRASCKRRHPLFQGPHFARSCGLGASPDQG